ncbi:MAG: sulfite exporter TauE/SafE family protein [Parvularculaceae bacterium]
MDHQRGGMAFLIVLFFLTALVYASVGFGGGSTYNALLVLNGIDYRILPTISLACNIIVVAGGVWRFGRAQEIDWRAIAPWIAGSIPAAWIGGRLPVSEQVFVGLLAFALSVAGVQLLLPARGAGTPARKNLPPTIAVAAGGALGFLSGVTGIGGGIFLSPLLHALKWGPARRIAGAASLFILANSVAGLAGQASKLGETDMAGLAAAYWPLLAAVLVGGQIGSLFGATRLPEAWLRRITGVLILYVAVRLIVRSIGI